MNKLNSEQIWMIVFIVLPTTLIANLGSEFAPETQMSVLYSGLFGGLGGLFGFLLHSLTKNKTAVIKSITLVLTVVILGFTIRTITAKPTDEQLISTDWTQQQIGSISFESPTKLNLTTSSIPEGTEQFYNSLEVYTDGNNDRLTSFINATILLDTLDLANSFGESLEGMLNNIGITEVELLDNHYMDTEEVASKFKFRINDEEVIGFGYMRNVGRTLQSIWLLPIKQGFSLEYIDKFENSIVTE